MSRSASQARNRTGRTRPSRTVRAVRTWWVQEGGWLRSTIVQYIYPGPVAWNDRPPDGGWEVRQTARGPVPEAGFFSIKPERRCLSGNRQLADAVKWASRPDANGRRQWPAIGAVTLLGRVMEHVSGYRSQGLRLDRILLLADSPGGLRDELADRYRCPVDVTTGPRSLAVRRWIEEHVRD